MDDAAQGRLFLDERTGAEGAEDALGGETLIGDGRVGGDSLAIEALQQLVSRQSDLEQIDQRFDAFGGLQEERPDGQRRFPLVMALLDVALLFELGE